MSFSLDHKSLEHIHTRHLLPAAGESDHGSLHGGAGGGRHRGDLYGDPVLSPVPQGAAEAGGACTVIENDCRSTLLFDEAFCGKLMTGPGSSGAGHFYRESNST